MIFYTTDVAYGLTLFAVLNTTDWGFSPFSFPSCVCCFPFYTDFSNFKWYRRVNSIDFLQLLYGYSFHTHTHTCSKGTSCISNPRYDYAKSGSKLNCFVHTADCYNILLFNRLMMAEAVSLQSNVNGCTHYGVVYMAVLPLQSSVNSYTCYRVM